MTRDKPTAICAWCPESAIGSHTIPANILKTARRLLGVTNIRPLLKPNLELQGLPTNLLLCQVHDNSFSPAENSFLQHLYKPLLTDSTEFEYDEWLIRFAISLAWKRLTTGLPLLPDLHPEIIIQAKTALTHWQGYLLNQHKEIEPYQHHLFLTKFIEKGDITDIHRVMLMTTFDTTIVPTNVGLFVQTTIPGCIFLSIIGPKDLLPDWKDTHIMPKGKFNNNQTLPGGVLFASFDQSLKDFQAAAKNISPRQRKIMKDRWPLTQIGINQLLEN